MGYRIQYGRTGKLRRVGLRRSGTLALTGLFFLLFLFLTVSFWPEGRSVLQRIVLPGDGAVTVSALETLSAQLRSGDGWGDALVRFCNGILEGAGLAPG